MGDVKEICRLQKVEVSQTIQLDQDVIESLVDLGKLFEAKKITDDAKLEMKKLMNDPAKLTQYARFIIGEISAKNPNAPAAEIFKTAIPERKNQARLRAYLKNNITGRKQRRKKYKELMNKMLDDISTLATIMYTAETAEKRARNIVKKENLPTIKEYNYKACFLGVRISAGIEMAIRHIKRKLSNVKSISKIIKDKIRKANSPGNIKRIIKDICRDHIIKLRPRTVPRKIEKPVEKPVEKPRVQKPKERTLLPAQLDASGRVGSGYGFAFAPKDKNNPRILADLGRGVLAQGGISMMWKILQEKHALQLDYLTSVPFKKKDDAASMLDFTSLSYISHPIKSLDFFAQAAYLFYKNDHPSERVEDKLDAFVGRLRLHYRPPIKKFTLSIDYDQNILAGRTNQILPEEKRTVLRTIGQLGPSFTFEHKGSKTTAFLGGVVGWNNKEGWKETKAKGTVYGGYAGAAFLLGNHEANLRFDYNNLFGMETMVRYFHDAPRWGIGGRLFYNFYSKKLNDAEADQHILGAAIAAKIIMFKIRKLPIGIWLEAQGAYETETENANLVLLATLKIGGLRFALPTRYRPNSLETPAEGK